MVRRAIKVVDAIAKKKYARAKAIRAKNQYEPELSFTDLVIGEEITTSPHKIRDDVKKNNSLAYCMVTGLPSHGKYVAY
jgi:hypothetical protein